MFHLHNPVNSCHGITGNISSSVRDDKGSKYNRYQLTGTCGYQSGKHESGQNENNSQCLELSQVSCVPIILFKSTILNNDYMFNNKMNTATKVIGAPVNCKLQESAVR